MYRRRSTHKPPDNLINQFRREFSDVMPSSTLQPSLPLEATAPGQDYSTFEFDPFGADFDHDEGTSVATGFAGSHIPLASDWDHHHFPQAHPGVDFQGILNPFGTPGPDGSAQPLHSVTQAELGFDAPTSTSASNTTLYSSRSHSMSMGESSLAQNFLPLHNSGNFQSVPSGLPPHAFQSHSNHHAPNVGAYGTALANPMQMAGAYDSESYPHQQLHHRQTWPQDSQGTLFPGQGDPDAADASNDDENDVFRFRCTLKASTAMSKRPDDVSVSYLNKTQLYEVSVLDTQLGNVHPVSGIRYRTSVRVAFQDSRMRLNPKDSWKLWWDGRGQQEAQKRGGKRMALECATPQGSSDTGRVSNVHVMKKMFDGFAVEWSPLPGKPAECALHMRFHFCSTDFTMSKGVKGSSIRLVATTQVLHDPINQLGLTREISYCIIKVFRDHGAERKFGNDRTAVAKQIDRAQKQVEQAETEDRDKPKRKRRGSQVSSRPSKIARTQGSPDSLGSSDEPTTAFDGLQRKLKNFQDMPSSVKPEHRFTLKGEEQDDLDTHPVVFPDDAEEAHTYGGLAPPAIKQEAPTPISPPRGGSMGSMPTSVPGIPGASLGALPYPTPPRLTSQSSSETRTVSNRPLSHGEGSGAEMHYLASPTPGPSSGKPRVGAVAGWDPDYKPPAPSSDKPVCCILVKPSIAGKRVEDDNYRAVYLRERTLHGFVLAVTAKCGIDAKNVLSTVRVDERGRQITVDDDMIEVIPEQQDLLAEFDPVDLTHETSDQLLKAGSEDGSTTPPIQYRLSLRY